MIKYTIDENQILIVSFIGKVNYNEIVDWLNEFTEIPELPLKLNLLYDLRYAILELDTIELIKVAQITKEATKNYIQIRTAFILNESKISKYKILFSFLKSDYRTKRKAYSNYDDAYSWLLLEKRKAELENLARFY